jgi:hypothetical protein
MATVTPSYASVAALTITLASLATSSTFLAGRESNEVDNSSNKYDDALVQGKVTVGTTPTVNTQIQIWVYASFDDAPSSTNIDVIDGVDSAETITNAGVRNSALAIGAVLDVSANTSDVAYPVKPFSIAQLFGGVMPKFWGLFVTHNTGVNLNSTGGNHVLEFVGIKYDIA